MHTLKVIRSQLGINQAEVARKINVSVPAYSTYENGQAIPCVEDMLILERTFGQKIEWNDTVNSEDKARIIQSLTILSESYPLSAVLIFAQKYLREGVKIGRPGQERVLSYNPGVREMDVRYGEQGVREQQDR